LQIRWALLAGADVGILRNRVKIHSVWIQPAVKPRKISLIFGAGALALALAVTFNLLVPTAASAATPAVSAQVITQNDLTSTTEIDNGQGGDLGILPRPNSGHSPKSSSDRGGWEQYLVMGSIVLALGVIVLLIRRESKRSKTVFDQRHADQ